MQHEKILYDSQRNFYELLRFSFQTKTFMRNMDCEILLPNYLEHADSLLRILFDDAFFHLLVTRSPLSPCVTCLYILVLQKCVGCLRWKLDLLRHLFASQPISSMTAITAALSSQQLHLTNLLVLDM